MRSLVILCALVAYAHGLIGFEQSAGVRGVLLCDGQPASGVKVKLYDEDDTDMDDLLEAGSTDSSGHFQLSGSTDEITPIEPKLNIYHDCDDWFPCQRRVTIDLPSSYITNGPQPQRFYDAGTIELSGKFKGETRDCFNRRRRR